MKERAMTDRVGQQLGNYRLLTLLGRGSFAEVYLGQHVRLPLQAAIKVLLSDFGLAALVHTSASEIAQGTAGTIAYMAPEQIAGHPRATSDQYALAVVVYEWLCGVRPFEGSPSEVMVQHLSLPPPPLRERMPEIPLEVEQVVLRALAKDPKARFASMANFASALEQASKVYASGQTLPLLAPGYSTVAGLRRSSLHELLPHRTLDNFPNNLPVQPTSIVGRVREVEAVCELMRRDEVRLLTLTGPGGTGKTRLALQVAAELSEALCDGVYFVNLAPLSDPALVIPTIAQTLDIKELPEQTLLNLLKASLHVKQVLLLLDNFEQVLDAAIDVAELLAACPLLKVLVTSRAVLHVQGEQQFAVPPLAVPDPIHMSDLVTLSQYEAVALFIQRAQAVKPEFQPWRRSVSASMDCRWRSSWQRPASKRSPLRRSSPGSGSGWRC
jgi:hypothetical protein